MFVVLSWCEHLSCLYFHWRCLHGLYQRLHYGFCRLHLARYSVWKPSTYVALQLFSMFCLSTFIICLHLYVYAVFVNELGFFIGVYNTCTLGVNVYNFTACICNCVICHTFTTIYYGLNKHLRFWCWCMLTVTAYVCINVYDPTVYVYINVYASDVDVYDYRE